MAKPLRNVHLNIPLYVYERKQVHREAREANLNLSDYVRVKLGLQKARKTRNARTESLENPEGDPESSVDVEELAKAILDGSDQRQRAVSPIVMTMADARREAKRRLSENA